MSTSYLFTSESVSEGHPDKLADQVSDAVLDECLRQDSESRVACETFTTTGMVLIGGEITTKAYVDFQEVARTVAKEVGYDNPDYGLDCNSMSVMSTVHAQSPDISQGVTDGEGLFEEQGAGDQGMMFGYACDETEELMPLPIVLAHKILVHAAAVRKDKRVPWLRPDAKSQVTVLYGDGRPKRIETIVVSHQHDDEIGRKELEQTISEEIITPVVESTEYARDGIRHLINPTGRFVVGGPHGDTGLTGRKIIVDTYGGMGRHGGGAFSGKDPSKVDRSAAYMARYVAKNIVAAGLAKRAEVALAYAIGVPYPVSVRVETFGTSVLPESTIEGAVQEVFGLSPAGIIRTLDLKRPIYRKTSTYGHFGRSLPEFLWEKTDKAAELSSLVKKSGAEDKELVWGQ